MLNASDGLEKSRSCSAVGTYSLLGRHDLVLQPRHAHTARRAIEDVQSVLFIVDSGCAFTSRSGQDADTVHPATCRAVTVSHYSTRSCASASSRSSKCM